MKRKVKGSISDIGGPAKQVAEASDEDEIDHDDLCAICHLLLYRPVTTRCGHTLCESCMAHWADVSISSQMTTVGLDDEPDLVLLPNDLETNCPMCRTSTTATLNANRDAALRRQYLRAYEVRKAEELATDEDESAASIEPLTLYIGNANQLIEPEDIGSGNKHDWKFFVRPSRTDLIEEVHIFLVISSFAGVEIY